MSRSSLRHNFSQSEDGDGTTSSWRKNLRTNTSLALASEDEGAIKWEIAQRFVHVTPCMAARYAEMLSTISAEAAVTHAYQFRSL